MRTSIKQAIAALPSPLNQAMAKIAASPNFKATISAQNVDLLLKLTDLSPANLLVALLPVAAAYAIVPISNFMVGAIARGETGRLYFGANMEFNGVQLNQSVHAEQSAISHAWLNGETSLIDITINYSPCGHCRQFMNELNGADKLNIQLPDKKAQRLHYYLPEAFGPKDLGVTQLLLRPVDHGLECNQRSNFKGNEQDLLINAALKAANRSHAPYSKNISGVAIRDIHGGIFSGMSAENAAFNPSLPPLQVALIAMNLACVEFNAIQDVVLVEKGDGSISHKQSTQAILKRICPRINLMYLSL